MFILVLVFCFSSNASGGSMNIVHFNDYLSCTHTTTTTTTTNPDGSVNTKVTTAITCDTAQELVDFLKLTK